MRIWTGILALMLSGCVSLDKLDQLALIYTAPLDESQLLHPEWAEPSPTSNTNRTTLNRSTNRMNNQDIDALARYLTANGIPYDVVPGTHLMLKLKQPVNFKTGSAYVSPQSKEWLDKLGSYLANQQDLDIVIDGHTDSTGGRTINESLSEKRAMQVKAQLQKNRVGANTIYTRGYGDYTPACSNETKQGRACNRRVEISFILASN